MAATCGTACGAHTGAQPRPVMYAAKGSIGVHQPDIRSTGYDQSMHVVATLLCRYAAGRHTPGTFTNQIQKHFEEPRLLLLTDPRCAAVQNLHVKRQSRGLQAMFLGRDPACGSALPMSCAHASM